MREACELIVKCWTEPEPFGWEGEFYQYRAVSIWPRPVQQPHPRLLMSGSSPDSVRLAAAFRATIGLLRIIDFDSARELRDMYIDLASKDGWEPGPEHFMVGIPCSIADNAKIAMETLKSGTKFFLGVLGGGIRTAQRLVLQKTRYYREEAHKERFPGRAARRDVHRQPVDRRSRNDRSRNRLAE